MSNDYDWKSNPADYRNREFRYVRDSGFDLVIGLTLLCLVGAILGGCVLLVMR